MGIRGQVDSNQTYTRVGKITLIAAFGARALLVKPLVELINRFNSSRNFLESSISDQCCFAYPRAIIKKRCFLSHDKQKNKRWIYAHEAVKMAEKEGFVYAVRELLHYSEKQSSQKQSPQFRQDEYVCPLCPKILSTAGNANEIQIHAAEHTDVKAIFCCEECSLLFYTGADALAHNSNYHQPIYQSSRSNIFIGCFTRSPQKDTQRFMEV